MSVEMPVGGAQLNAPMARWREPGAFISSPRCRLLLLLCRKRVATAATRRLGGCDLSFFLALVSHRFYLLSLW